MFNKNKFWLLKWSSASALVITSTSLSTIGSSSCSKSNSYNAIESKIIHIAKINDNEICKIDSSLFPERSSYSFNKLESDIVLGVNELTNYDITELTIVFSTIHVPPIAIQIRNDQQQSEKKYDGITFKSETNPKEFENNKFSKILRIKKSALKEILCDLSPTWDNDVNITFSFNKTEKENGLENTSNLYINLNENDPQELKNGFKGVKLNTNDSTNIWYKTDEPNVKIDKLSSIIIAYDDNSQVQSYASDDQYFFIRKKFDNLPDNFDKQLIFKNIKTEGNITIFELENIISPILGDIYVTNIHSEYIEPNINDYYHFVDESNNTIFLPDESVETNDPDVEISGFYFDVNKEKKAVQYNRKDFNYIVNVGKNITTIGNNFLYGCKKIEYVNFVNGLDKIYSIGSDFLNNCDSLKSIKINDDIVKLSFDWNVDNTDSIQFSTIGTNFLKGCTSFNQEININNKVNILSGFLRDCTNFNSNITIDKNYSGIINMLYFMTNCDNMVSTITLNAPRRAKNMEHAIFNNTIDDKTTLTTRNKNANSYINGIKIASDTSPDHITTFMNLVPNLDNKVIVSIYYRKLISIYDNV